MAVKSLAQSSILQPSTTKSMLAGYESNYFHHLETVRLGGTAANLTFSNLARYSDYQHLQIRVVVRGTVGTANIAIRINGVSTNSYAVHRLVAEYTGGVLGVASSGASSQTDMNFVAVQGRSTSAANAFGASIVEILDAFEPQKNRVIRVFGGQLETNDHVVGLFSGLLNDSTAISSIILYPGSGSFAAGSRFSLYGLKARA